MGVVTAIAAVGSTVVAVQSANNQRKVQERATGALQTTRPKNKQKGKRGATETT